MEKLFQIQHLKKYYPIGVKREKGKPEEVINLKAVDDVTFSDGTPMTMDDVLFSVKRYQDPDLASYLLWMYDSVESIEQTGDWQFTVKLKQPDALWKHTFATTAGMIHSKAYVEAHPITVLLPAAFLEPVRMYMKAGMWAIRLPCPIMKTGGIRMQVSRR